ncbi:hypothetical protein B0H10DRAFT_1771728 [Mycena sp. CBHHK59/15]|nr:hypothetical protein B0H10DRAFT_1771728 [Mycena sp. CBHHK59/15]
MASPRSNRDQYQHFIPRFILRRFQVGGTQKKEYSRTGLDPESVLFYDLAANTLAVRSIGSVYGVKNLYQDTRSQNINELEEKLSKLENDAAGIVNDLHAALGAQKRQFTLKRKGLDRLRKFLFLQHYRNSTLSKTYFQEDHPENQRVREWTEKFRERHGLDSATDVWLHSLRYFLDTSHAQISLDATQMYKKYGMISFLAMMETAPIDPDAEHFHAVAYQMQAGSYFLCVWEAADGQEFILGSNGFGLWEGRALGVPGLHRIFIISPRLALVLGNGIFRPEVLPGVANMLDSDLLDIQHALPLPTYSDGSHGIPLGSDDVDIDTLVSYKASKQAEEDSFTFEITKLTSSQTLAINSVILLNVPTTGSITFASKSSALRTCRLYQRSIPGRLYSPNKFKPLILTLKPSTPSTSPTVSMPPGVDLDLFQMLLGIVTSEVKFRSEYDRAKAILELLKQSQSSFAIEHQRILSALSGRYTASATGSATLRKTHVVLANSLPESISTRVFATLARPMLKLGLEAQTDILEKVQNQVATIAFLQWVSGRGDEVRDLVGRELLSKIMQPSK